MAIRVALNHKTSYLYDRLVSLSPQIVRLRPAPHCRTPVSSYSLRIDPTQHFTAFPPRYTEASLQKKLEEEGLPI